MERDNGLQPGSQVNGQSEPQPPQSGSNVLDLACRAAHGGDQEALVQVIMDCPEAKEQVADFYGDLGGQAVNACMDWALKDAEVRRTMTAQRFEAVREQLSGPDQDPLVTILAERTAICWLQTSFEDEAEGKQLAKGEPHRASLHRARGQAAQRRLLEAARTLALVRRILEAPASPQSSRPPEIEG